MGPYVHYSYDPTQAVVDAPQVLDLGAAIRVPGPRVCAHPAHAMSHGGELVVLPCAWPGCARGVEERVVAFQDPRQLIYGAPKTVATFVRVGDGFTADGVVKYAWSKVS